MTHQLWPPVVDPSTLSRQVWDSGTARAIPGVGRALSLYGLLGQCRVDVFRGIRPLPRSRFLERPDLRRTLPSFVKLHVEDYLLHGNAAHLVTARDSYGYPASVRWYPAHQWDVVEVDGRVDYYLNGHLVRDPDDVVHVKRGADPVNPSRGVGVVEQHVRALDRVALGDAAEASNLRGRGVPSVAIITPQSEPKEADLDAAADKWVERFSSGEPRPGFFPKGTELVPLSWSPNDQQMTEARRLGLTDVANAFNLDAYWLGAPGSSHTYRSPGPMYLTLLRTSLDDVAVELEDEWSWWWVPRGQRVKLDREPLLRDDMATSVKTAAQAYREGLWTLPETRSYLGRDPEVDIPRPAAPAAAVEAPEEPEQDVDEPVVDDDEEATE